MRRRTCSLLLAPLAFAAGVDASDTHELITFKKIVLTTEFHGEGAGIGDFNNDGKMDVFYGAQWYAGPSFKDTQAIFAVRRFDPTGYSNNFITMIEDVNGDGHVDVIVHEWPGKAVHWFENPAGKVGVWKKHVAHANADNESPQFADLTGDGRPELVFTHQGRLGYAGPGSSPTQPWPFTSISEKGKWHRYSHGLGVGDINGDGRPDFLMAEGWWEHPDGKRPGAAGSSGSWTKHAVAFGAGGAQMYAYDVDGDGDSDVITSLAAHGYGLAWFEQRVKGGKIEFTRHEIMGATSKANPYGVKFSQLHAVCLEDMDGDGLKDIVTGKRYWAHGPKGDAEPGAPAVLYWFKLTRTEKGVHYIPYLIDSDSGVGTQFAVGDVNGDARPDVVVGNKKGGYVFLQRATRVSRVEWEKAQPKRLNPNR